MRNQLQGDDFLPKIRVSRIEVEIAMLEAQGYDERAEGIRDLFRPYISGKRIADLTARYERVLGENNG